MPNYSLLFARTLDEADNAATVLWKWDRSSLLHSEFRRPDNGELVRFVVDQPDAIRGLRWNTRAYFAPRWELRRDAATLMTLAEQGFFKVMDPQMAPPRAPRKRREEHLMSELKSLLRGDLR